MDEVKGKQQLTETNQILPCDKLVDEYNHSYHHSIGKRPIDADFSSLAEKI